MAKTPAESVPEMIELDPRGALDAAIDGARLASPLIDRGDRQFAFVPEGYNLKDISDPARLPDRVRQDVAVDDRASLIAFVNRFSNSDTVLFADFDALTISAVIDFHTSNEPAVAPRAGDFVARFKLLPSEEFLRWDKMEGEMWPQAVFAEFLDENSMNISDPEPATMLEISRELEATIGAVFKAKVSLQNGDRAFTYETETKTKGDLVVPKRFTLCIPLFNGEGPELLEANFRFRPTGEGLTLGFFWHRVEVRRRAFFNEIAAAVSEGTGRPVFNGRAPAPKGLIRAGA